jgi:isocitrate/isopropylmalate dehydrogenase
MKFNILSLPGDGIGVEVTREAIKVLHVVAGRFKHEIGRNEGARARS